MASLHISIYAMSLAISIFAAILALRVPAKHLALPLFFSAIVVMYCSDWLMHQPTMPFKNLWLFCLMASAFVISPCALTLAESLCKTKQRIWPKKRHALIVVSGWGLLIPLATAIHGGNEFANSAQPISANYSLFIHSTMLAAVALFLIQTALALQICFRFLKKRGEQNRFLFSSTGEPGLNILRVLVVAIAANALVSLLRVLHCALLEDNTSLSLFYSTCQLVIASYVALSVIRQTSFTAPQHEIIRQKLFPIDRHLIVKGENSKLATPTKQSMSDQKFNRVLAVIHQRLDELEVYKTNGLSLRDLCDQIGETPHTVSYVINHSELESFYHMINKRRVDLAATLLISDANKTILDIAFECGFGSKSSFNGVFKRYLGQTPSQYRKTNRKTAPQEVQADRFERLDQC